MNKTIDFIEELNYSLPYTENDILKAIEFGRQQALSEVESLMVGHVINGVLKNVLTEEKFKELLSK